VEGVGDGRGGFAVKRALVTGAHGFVASHLARALLERGDAVTVLDLAPSRLSGLALQGIESEVESVEADLRDARPVGATLEAGEFDVVFHLAAQTLVGPAMTDPAATFEVNVRGTWNLLEACRRADVPAVVVASSDKAYGPHERLPYREDFPLRPASPYEASKAAADAIALSYAPAYGLPVVVTRFANIYGGGDLNFSRLVPEAIVAVLEGRRPAIRSDGRPQRDFLYVDDSIAAYLAIEHEVRRPGGGGGVQRRRRASPLGGRGAGGDCRGRGRRPRARIPRHRQPGRGDRSPVRRLGEAAGADRLAP
jgi:CDP-glucose 4,6-dehydratase